MMDGVEGPHYTFVDPRLCEDSKAMVEQARRLSDLFGEKDEHRDVIIGVREMAVWHSPAANEPPQPDSSDLRRLGGSAGALP